MADATIIVYINGYWNDHDKQDIPDHSGLFFVYESKVNSIDNTIDLLRLLYIGEAENIRNRIMSHEKYSVWLKSLNPGNELCYSAGLVEEPFRHRVEAAYIFCEKPALNDSHPYSFNFDRTTLITMGKTALLRSIISLRKNQSDNEYFSPSLFQGDPIPVRAIHTKSFPGK